MPGFGSAGAIIPKRRGFGFDIASLLSGLGISADTATAVGIAAAVPSIQNIQNVQSAFDAEGASPPDQLMQQLWGLYYQTTAQNPLAAAGNVTAWLSQNWGLLLIGGVVLFAVMAKKR
jgi:hypothetical protein